MACIHWTAPSAAASTDLLLIRMPGKTLGRLQYGRHSFRSGYYRRAAAGIAGAGNDAQSLPAAGSDDPYFCDRCGHSAAVQPDFHSRNHSAHRCPDARNPAHVQRAIFPRVSGNGDQVN